MKSENDLTFDLNPVVQPGFLSAGECASLVQEFMDGEKISGVIRSRARSNPSASADALQIRNNTVCWLHLSETTSWIYRKITAFFRQMNESKYKFEITELQTIQLAEYKHGVEDDFEFYKTHLDICTIGYPGAQRKLSMSVQLSLPENYEGGDLRIFGDENNRILDPATFESHRKQRREQGAAIVFPSFFSHEITAVTNGTRHSLVAWMEGPNWK